MYNHFKYYVILCFVFRYTRVIILLCNLYTNSGFINKTNQGNRVVGIMFIVPIELLFFNFSKTFFIHYIYYYIL